VNKLFAVGVGLLCLAGAVWIIHWAVPSSSWHDLHDLWGTVAFFLLGVVSLPFTAVLFHELAHGAAAALTGYRISTICFWAPVSMIQIRLFGIWFVCGRTLRRSGYCMAYPKRMPRSRPFLYPAAGPLMTLLLVVGATLGGSAHIRGLSLWCIGAAFLNVLYFASSIVPRIVWISGRPALTDGARLLALLRPMTPADRIDLKLSYASGLSIQGLVAELESLVSECRQESPEHRGAALFQAWLHWRRDRPQEASELYESCLGDHEEGFQAKMALALLRCAPGPLQNLEQADLFSQQLVAGMPGNASAWLMRAIVLGHRGRSEEAQHFLEMAYENLLDPGERGYAAGLKGLQFASQQNVRQAERCLRQALYLGAPYSTVKALARAVRQSRKPTRTIQAA